MKQAYYKRKKPVAILFFMRENLLYDVYLVTVY